MDHIVQLYPLPSQERPLKGTYLAHQLRQYSQASGKAFVYSNFITSLDGRIAIRLFRSPCTKKFRTTLCDVSSGLKAVLFSP
jgi:hypothetical protein